MRTVAVTRYVTPLREGGSLPGLVEASDDGLYVLKFRGAGQGPRALVAELISGELARAAGLPVPEIVFAEVDRDLARTEPDPEIHQLIHDSAGLNLALDFLPGSVTFEPLIHEIDAAFASCVVWFDAFVTNVDRTARNTNMLMWHRRPWLIDHGATLFFHHAPGWMADSARATSPFAQIEKHVLLTRATAMADADAAMSAALTPAVIQQILDTVPDAWLGADGADPFAARAAYVRYFTRRLEAPRAFAEAIGRG